MYKAATRGYDGYEMATRGVMWVQGNYKRYELGMRQLQGGMVGMKQLQEVQSRYKAATKGVKQVQSSYKGCDSATSGMR